MSELLGVFLAIALLLYILFGGADYGAGILEIFKGKKLREQQSELITKAIGPVWEANHMWLILMLVILFVGFPSVYHSLSTSLHIPVIMVLAGVVMRGSAFTFRHYDAIKDSSQKVYSFFFSLSSVWTSVWLGITAASLHRGLIKEGSQVYFEQYVAPWFGLYPLAFGLFVSSLFTFLSSVFLIGETQAPSLRSIFQRRAFYSNISTVALGALVFLSAELEGNHFARSFFESPASLVSLTLATVLLFALWHFIKTGSNNRLRIVAVAQTSLIIIGWLSAFYPNLVVTSTRAYTFTELAAPPAVLKQILIALIVGLILILPSLFYLFHVFKKETFRRKN